MPLQRLKVETTSSDFLKHLQYLKQKREKKQKEQVETQRIDYLAASICAKIEELKYYIVRAKKARDVPIEECLVKFKWADAPVQKKVVNKSPQEVEEKTPEQIMEEVKRRTIQQKAAMFAALGMNIKAKWEGD